MILSALRVPLRITASPLLRRGLATAPQSLRLKQTDILPRLSTTRPAGIIFRGAASSVSGRPGSQTLEHAAENIREELGNSTADLAKTIAGGNYYSDSVQPKNNTFVCILTFKRHER